MPVFNFPRLALADWQPTRDTITTYAKMLGKIRQAFTPPQKHWWHISLRAAASGLTTTPIPVAGFTFEMLLDLTAHKLVVSTSRGEQWHQPLRGQSAAVFSQSTLAALAQLGVEPEIDRDQFSDATPGNYDVGMVERYWHALSQIDALFKQFKSELRRESSPVQLWPHHFDLAVVWFSGRLVPGVDPADEEQADEQMNFGFATGDEGIPDPYFYVTAYPTPAGLLDTPLPEDATWHSDGFTGAVLMYETLLNADAPGQKLLAFLRAAHQAGAELMK